MDQKTPPTYPSATDQVSKMMGFDKGTGDHSDHSSSASAPAHLPVVDLPSSQVTQVNQNAQHEAEVKDHLHKLKEEITENPLKIGSQEPVIRFPIVQIVKVFFPYLLIFIVGVFLYTFFFSNYDFSKLFKVSTHQQSAQDVALQNLEKKNLGAYDKWVAGYYFSVSDASVIDPNTDNSGNGLTNFQKYLLDLNPKSYDTLGLGMADSQALSQGINPLSGQPLNDAQKQIVAKYFNMEAILNNLTLSNQNASTTGQVAGAQTTTVPVVTPTPVQSAVSNDNLPTSFGTAPVTNSQYGDNILHADLDINTNIPGELDIPSMNIKAPLIFSNSSANFETDLKSGIIHYPGTALPGEIGTTYIAGHSSNYPWIKSDYNHIFTHLDQLTNDQSFSITVTLKNGNKATLHYVVTGNKQFSPTDPAQIANSGKSIVALSTCWPVNTTQKRLVVFGELTQIEQ